MKILIAIKSFCKLLTKNKWKDMKVGVKSISEDAPMK